MDKMKDVALLVGRVLLALMFVMAGWGKIGGYAGTQGYMEAMGVPGFMLPLVILLELGGGLAIMLGLFTRSLSVLLAGFTLIACRADADADVHEERLRGRWFPGPGGGRCRGFQPGCPPRQALVIP